jgi:ribosome assembly protein YihI (activator of Der GTPase)
MKQKILEALKAKFVGVSDAILNRVADKLAKTVTSEEQVATAVEGTTFQQVLESYGDSRATEAQQTAVKNYEAKYGLKDGNKTEPLPQQTTEQKQDTTGGEQQPAWVQALIESNKKLSDRLDAMEAGKTAETRKQKLNAVIDKLPESLRKAYERTPVDNGTDEEFNSLLESITQEVNGILTDTQARGAVFGRPLGGKSQGASTVDKTKEATDAEATAVVDRLNI